MILYLFWSMTLGACAYVAAVGGRDARWAASLILAASLASIPALLAERQWLSTDVGLLAVDGLLLAGLYALSLRSRSYFPIWMTGFQLVAVTVHLATMLAPDFAPRIYQALEQVWAIPMTLAMTLGVALDTKAGIHDVQRG